MKRLFYIPLCFFMLLHIQYIYAQQNIFYRIPERPNKLIATFTGIAQDKEGFIWLSSYQGGLHRYDGTGYTTYMNDPLDANSISSNYSECLMIDTADIIWIGIFGGGLDRFDRSANTFTHFRHEAKNNLSIANDTVTSIIQDHKGNIWIGTYGGLDLLNTKNNTFIHYPNVSNDSTSLSHNHVRIVYEDKDGDIWAGCGSPFANDTGEQTDDGGLNKLNRSTGKFTRYLHNAGNPNTIEANKVTAIFQDSKRNLWIGTKGNGLHSLNKNSGIFTHYYYDPKRPEKLSRPPIDPNSQSDHIRFIKEDVTGAIWIGSWLGGLNRYDPITKIIKHYGQVSKNRNVVVLDTLSGFNEYSPWMALSSRDSLFWLSSYSHPNTGNLYYNNPFKSAIPYHNINAWINCFFQENDSTLWIGTYSGLIRKNLKTGTEKLFKNNPKDSGSISNSYPEAILADDKGNLWIGTDSGLNKYNPLNNTFTSYLHDDENHASIISNGVSCLFIDKNKNLWIGTDKGLDVMKNISGQFYHYTNNASDSNSIGSSIVNCLNQSEANELWIGMQNGLYRMNIKTGKCTRYLAPLIITSILIDSYKVLWVSTHQGLYVFDKEKNKFQPFNEPNSQIVFTTVMNVQEDDNNNLWVHTPDALVRINEKRNMVKIFGESYGKKTINNFNVGGLKANDGKIYFPSEFGYYSFYPDSLNENTQPKIYLTDFKINDAEVTLKPGSIIKLSLWQTEQIKLHYNQNNFSFGFLAIHYKSPGEEKYLYTLENYDKEWHHTGKEHKAYFFNVPPGNYVFKIRAVNPDGEWSEKQTVIIISPPWYKTWWAYTIFIVTFIALIWAFVHYRSIALRRENKILEEKVLHRTEQLNHSLTELKSTQAQLIQSEKMASLGELTAGIAHEIQNPLNFVNNFSEVNKELVDELKSELATGNLQSANEIADDIKANEEKINHHGKRADAIVKGMLQHSRSSVGEKEPTDINALCDEYLRLSYHGLRAKDNSFNATINTDFDNSIGKINIVPQDIGRVLLNLFNNAFYAVNEKCKMQNAKYQPTVSVQTKKEENRVCISVRDNGNGIPQNIIDKIFQPFFTTKPTGQGTGLGLSLSYDIIKSHSGEIKVATKDGEGSEFIIQLPV